MKWRYEVTPARGEVEARDEGEAIAVTTADALGKAPDAIVAGTWEMRKVEDDRS